MRIFFSGSIRHLKGKERTEFKKAGRELGVEVAARGHTALLHSEHEETIDAHLVDGMCKHAGAAGIRVPVEIHRGIKAERIFSKRKRLAIRPVPYHWVDSSQLVSTRLGARAGGIAAADAVVLVGGSNGTRLVGRLAIDLRKPLVAIGCFGGTAQEFYEKNECHYRSIDQVLPHTLALQGKWETGNAASVLEICELLGARHSYFLSYSHREPNYADHIEALLRRADRTVYRDERELKAGDPLRRQVRDRILRSDTFVSLWSRRAARSPWCRWELDEAWKARKAGPRPSRVVLILVDAAAIPRTMKASLQLQGGDRTERINAVQQLREGEPGESKSPMRG